MAKRYFKRSKYSENKAAGLMLLEGLQVNERNFNKMNDLGLKNSQNSTINRLFNKVNRNL